MFFPTDRDTSIYRDILRPLELTMASLILNKNNKNTFPRAWESSRAFVGKPQKSEHSGRLPWRRFYCYNNL